MITNNLKNICTTNYAQPTSYVDGGKIPEVNRQIQQIDTTILVFVSAHSDQGPGPS